MRLYGKKYLSAIVKKNQFDLLAVMLRWQAYDFFYKHACGDMNTKQVEEYYQHLLSAEQKLSDSRHQLSWFYLSLAFMGYHQKISHSLNDFLKAVDMVQKWRPNIIKQVSPETEMFDIVLKASAMVEGRQYHRAYQVLSGILEQTMYPYPPLHTMTFIISAINTGHYHEAEKLIEQLISSPSQYIYEQTFCYMSLIQCLLLQERYAEVPPIFAKLNCLNSGRHAEADDLIIRIYETMFSFLSDDMITAESILKKNTQWMKRRKEVDQLSGEFILLQTLKKCLVCYWKQQPVDLKYDESLTYINIHQPSFYKTILERINIRMTP